MLTDALMRGCDLSSWAGDAKSCRWCNRKLKGRQERWCGNACPSKARDQHHWASARVVALRRDGYLCVRCGDRDPCPNVHHRDDQAFQTHREYSCRHHVEGLETLCRPCHKVDTTRQAGEAVIRRRQAREDAWNAAIDSYGGAA